ncbi:MAG: tetratricopeptide repeat protein [Pseudomonadota bacterium]
MEDSVGCSRGAVFYDQYRAQCSDDDGTVTDPGACIALGRGYAFGHGGLEIDKAKAETEFKKACAVNDARGCYNLGSLYYEGLSDEPNGDLAEAALEQACNLEYGPGCSLLGTVYVDGLVEGRDESDATLMWDRGCTQGDLETCLFLGDAYADTPEIEGSGAAAVYYYELGCRAPHHASCCALAFALVKGELVPQNKPAARELFDRLCEAGDVPVCNSRYLFDEAE